MATETSSIDDLLATQSSPSIPPVSEDMGSDEAHESQEYDYEEEAQEEQDNDDDGESESRNLDDYGNPKSAPKTYTEEEVNERVRRAFQERFEKRERRSNQNNEEERPQRTDQSNEDWENQLKEFVKKTVSSMGAEEQARQHQEREAIAQAQFEQKFQSSMGKFNDFTEVVGKQPITDAMVIATREMKDPAAFLYAASKRAPQELSRISQIRDPYAQIAAMGALETSLKKTSSATKAPRPMSRTFEDGEITHKSQKDDSIEDLIQKSERKKLAVLNSRRR